MHLKEPKLYRMNRRVKDPAFYLSSSFAKAPIYVFIVSFLVGFGRFLFIGYHPIVNGLILGSICGTMAGKLLKIEQTGKEKKYTFYIWAVVVFGLAVFGQIWGIKYSLPGKEFSFLLESWTRNDFREFVLWNPLSQPSTYLDSTNQTTWLITQLLDLIALAISGSWGLKIAKKPKSRGKKTPTEWPIYRMLLLFGCFLFSLYYTSKPLILSNRSALSAWHQELWAEEIMSELFSNEATIASAPNSKRSLKTEDGIIEAANSSYPFPEGHLWIALKQMEKGNQFLVKDELDRAVWETERLDRRILLPNGQRMHRKEFLAHLYQIRGKYHLKNERFLLAERDLTVSIIQHKELWPLESAIPANGYYKHEESTLERAELNPDIGFGAAHYERHIVRLKLGDKEQASYDLKEAESLGYER